MRVQIINSVRCLFCMILKSMYFSQGLRLRLFSWFGSYTLLIFFLFSFNFHPIQIHYWRRNKISLGPWWATQLFSVSRFVKIEPPVACWVSIFMHTVSEAIHSNLFYADQATYIYFVFLQVTRFLGPSVLHHSLVTCLCFVPCNIFICILFPWFINLLSLCSSVLILV